MIAKTQYEVSAADLTVVLALVRSGTLNAAGARLELDASTVFRTIQRIEKSLGIRLFERSRSGFLPSELARDLALHAERIESHVESARSALQTGLGQVSGAVRLTTTDTLLHGLVAPGLKQLQLIHPLLSFELDAGNELASLTRRDADIAVRATKRPPAHLIGRHVGPIRAALYAAKKGKLKKFDPQNAESARWIAPDEALPEHPSVIWRKRHFPKATPIYRVNSILTVAELVAQDLGIGILPIFLARSRNDLVQITEEIEACQTQLWLLMHTESRHLRRVSAVFGHLSQHLALP